MKRERRKIGDRFKALVLGTKTEEGMIEVSKSQAVAIKIQTTGSTVFSFSIHRREESVSKVLYSVNINEYH